MGWLGKLLILVGVIFILTGMIILALNKFVFKEGTKLPGDILIKRDGITFYFPITSAIVISILLTVLLNVLLWFLIKK